MTTIETRMTGSSSDGDGVMDNQQVSHEVSDRGRRGCLVEGCPCKDARIVSQRRTAFFAAWARDHGETANRSVAPDVEWRIPSLMPTAA
ncbi:MAG TPA: hypothetical protein VE640_04980 [Candidatus Bathyarchaeia archaeon]|nr:hypothetical protein [Candidatus Bathyarchaeia archaeon]